ncbi:MAG: hypothetical protein K8F91_23625 [Candidatus Obscuribacterales bacterium]|nr:hypothetical protein [Candidatus Obscuribacterales bacterium]
MPGSNQPKADNLNSALNLWQEAVEKASVDLDKIVNNSIHQLKRLGEDLEQKLDAELSKAASETESTLTANVDELSGKKDELQEQLGEFERRQVERMLNTAQEARANIDRLVVDTKREVMEQFALKLKDLSKLLEDPGTGFADIRETKRQSIPDVIEAGTKAAIARESESKESLSQESDQLSNEVLEVIQEGRNDIDLKLEEYAQGFDMKITNVLEQLDQLGEKTRGQAIEITEKGQQQIEEGKSNNQAFLAEHIDSFSSSIATMKSSFQKELTDKTSENLAVHSRRLEYQVSEAKATINHVTSDANARVMGIHKSLYGQLKRLERRYQDRVHRQLLILESVIAEEKAIPTDSKALLIRSQEELCQRLDTELQARGGELVKSIRKQVEQLEDDFRRASDSSSERFDSIKLQAIESLEKQVRIIRSELDRINKTFKGDLAQLSTELPEIEERGRVAAMSVQAYRASMLTLESD